MPASENEQLRDVVTHWIDEIEARVAEEGWGQPLNLWLCATTPMGPDSTGNTAVMVGFASFPPPEEVRDAPADFILDTLSQALDETPTLRTHLTGQLPGDRLSAIAISAEAYTIPDHDVAAWNQRNWAQHPDRCKVRTIMAVDITGRRYTLRRDRGDTAAIRRHSDQPDFSDLYSVGHEHDHLSKILAQLRDAPQTRR